MEALFENSSKTKQKFDLSVVALQPEQTKDFGTFKVTPFPVVHGESGGPFLAYRIESRRAHHRLQRRHRMDRRR